MTDETTEQRLRRERDEAVAFARSEGKRADTAFHSAEYYKKYDAMHCQSMSALFRLLKKHGYVAEAHYPKLVEPETPLTRGSSYSDRTILDCSKYVDRSAVVLKAFEALLKRTERAERALGKLGPIGALVAR